MTKVIISFLNGIKKFYHSLAIIIPNDPFTYSKIQFKLKNEDGSHSTIKCR